jgi:hypothetical protein
LFHETSASWTPCNHKLTRKSESLDAIAHRLIVFGWIWRLVPSYVSLGEFWRPGCEKFSQLLRCGEK